MVGPSVLGVENTTVLATSSPVGEAAAASWPEVGPGLAAALAGVDVAATEYVDLLEVAGRWEALRAWADATQAEVLAALDRRAEQEATVVVATSRGRLHDVWHWHRDQVALALGVGSPTAARRLLGAQPEA